MSEREKELTAYHEAGHAVVGRFVPNHDPLHRISIISRGMLGGHTRFLPPEDRHYLNRSQFSAMLASALGGQAAELMVFGEISTSARDDIQTATHIARRMVTEYGMSERLGTVGARNEYSDKMAEAVDDEIRRLVDAASTRASGSSRTPRRRRPSCASAGPEGVSGRHRSGAHLSARVGVSA